ncbi:hypothetical protein Tco_0749562 [Tanacetum coccineum]|uniref:Reverse transcriptase domain-containing protein n=1 Tax=Tanacetum coccineum TaxID=301880 RepID=A0ABQ4Z025_9ASTR
MEVDTPYSTVDQNSSPTTSVPVASPVPRALSPVCTDLLPPCKRIRDSIYVTDFEVSLEEGYVPYIPRDISLGVDVEGSYEPYTKPDIDPGVQEDIDACIMFADDIAARGTNVRVKFETTAKEEAESSARGTIKIGFDQVTHPVILDDTVEPVREDYPNLVSADGSLEVMQRGLDVVIQDLYDHMVEISFHRVIVIESFQSDQGHRIMATSQQSVAMSERIGMLEWDNMRLRGMLGVERQRVDHFWRSMSYVQRDLRQIRRFRFYDCLIAKCVAEALEAYDAARNSGTEIEIENEQQDDNVEANVNNGNGNGNGNGNPNVNNEGVVGLTYWFEKMETMFHINNCSPKYQMKYASCTLLDGALTWWNSYKRTVGVDVAYAMTWKALMKLMMMWFQELTLLCTMVPKEEDKVEKYIGGLPDNIQGNVIDAEPTRLQEEIRFAINFID